MNHEDTIIALATAPGLGAIAVIRLSGPEALTLVAPHFKARSGKQLLQQHSHTIHLGHIVDGDTVLDEVLVSIFKAPHSYTGENVVEISCQGSLYIQERVIQLFLRAGCRMAKEGEFTLRAFLNGKMDLSQAEAVADLIASDSEASHRLALQQMRGGFSTQIQALRQELLDFASLIELELDFSQEDVEFADKAAFNKLLDHLTKVLERLIDSFALGNVLKQGIPVAIVGAPNVGKSTLLNALLNEERAIVSDIAGTTRDTIEDQISLGGITFRFIDTAGIRATEDQIEQMGIERTLEKIEQAALVLYLVDATATEAIPAIQEAKDTYIEKPLLIVVNKVDEIAEERFSKFSEAADQVLLLSAKFGTGIEQLKNQLLVLTNTGSLGKNDTLVTNNRHYDALQKALAAIVKVKEGLAEELPSDLMAIDLREALYHLGEITGQVTTDDLLGNIFSNFCIGK
ncbi:MAG: tRNA uridine-5-carboxymethylaminomethyl(34) synthesis GTPase MnmE [Bacteroidota bacterium]